jgi:hypothetical protein
VKRRLAAALLALGLAGPLVASWPAGTAVAYPPYTCGTVTQDAKNYVVRSHGPTCGFALNGTRRYLRTHRSPPGFRCTTFSGSVSLDCVSRRSRYRYFLASPS